MRKIISKIKKSISSKLGSKKKKVPVAKKPAPVKKGKPIGAVTHFYGDIGVAIIKFKRVFKAGEKVHFIGATTNFKETVKSMRRFLTAKNLDEAKKLLSVAYKALDKAAKGGVIKKNTASRKKSRLARAINKLK